MKDDGFHPYLVLFKLLKYRYYFWTVFLKKR